MVLTNIRHWLDKAEHSRSVLRLVNLFFWRLIPFNRPHGIRIHRIDRAGVQVELPYRKRNCNHLDGLHACALATAAEFAAGVALLQFVDTSEYRLIMKHIAIDYHSQGKKTAIAVAVLNEQVLELVSKQLPDSGEVDIEMQVTVVDVLDKKLCTATVNWQLKSWSLVRAK